MRRRSYIVFGCGKFGSKVAEELMKADAEVMVVDRNEEIISEIADVVTDARVIDSEDEKELFRLGLENYDGAIITMTDNLAACVTAVSVCKESGIPIIIAKVSSERHGNIMKRIGATQVIIPEHDSAIKTAGMLQMQNILNVMELSDEIVIAEIPVREHWVGKTLIDLKLPARENINVIAARKDGRLSTDIDPSAMISADESFVIVTDKKKLAKTVSED